ncbi:hypothetical protein PFICI_09899 [Pestalotiopsis fici W106-1]|uniref:FAD-binding PCMH-type domain-containing protein n=1 Tax=Pestalotiopsis fici (strain W106-1 / CGMCC3.15140) TaxID=1229662 RepID=W3WXJ1_PESFW|nr:uncharacterized protein PFICI_09899 [Pestalotiopsis fici W106-1]ETS77837.1 hypothetical protein PFICI_09899 [Pestalotiopsis fici W106-1]
MNLLLSAVAIAAATVASAQESYPVIGGDCKVFPGDAAWPSDAEWASLNETVSGRLVKTVPLGSPCHDPNYNATLCEELKDEWLMEPIHFNSTSSVMAPFFANQSCDPWQPQSRPCELGNYVRYAVDVAGAEDIQATIAFARENNIRFVIRNTGHDFNGRSTGAGALSVRTHGLKDIEFIDEWVGVEYTGPAVKVGAGVQGFEIVTAANSQGRVVVTGECPTVGLAGGYTQGGGHSALSNSYGLSADNVLEWEVVTADGQFLIANETSNPDLFWALRGGGPGTYGVVTSLTVRTHPDAIVSGAALSFLSNSTTTETFWHAVQTFHELLPAMVDAGVMLVYTINTEAFGIPFLTAYNKTAAECREVLSPFLESLGKLGINPTVSFTESQSYLEHYNETFGPLPWGGLPIDQGLFGGRLVPRDIVSNITSLAFQELANLGVAVTGVSLDVSRFGSTETTSVVPAWRSSLIHAVLNLPWSFTAPWSDMVAQVSKMTEQAMPILEAATPGSGAYVNEADFQQPNFQEVFWGTNYERLLAIKAKYDPENFLYTRIAPGSEAWTVADDGRMCRSL